MIKMVSLFNLFVNNNNKPKQSFISNAVVSERRRQVEAEDRRRRANQSKAWKDAMGLTKQGVADPVGKSITDNSLKMAEHDADGTLYTGPNSGSGGGGSSDYGGSGGGGSSGGSSSESDSTFDKEAYKRALSSISNMKDSNVFSKKKFDYNDFWTQATKGKQNDMWGLKEEIFLYTFHDKQKHRYLQSINIDCDKTEILGTCDIAFQYDQKLMEYWIPGKTTFAVVGGTFDREVLFVGRVAEINQVGDQIQMVGHNVGWKFKAYMSTSFQNSLQKMSVKNAVKLIFKKLGFTNGRYHIDLKGIPNLSKYKLDENCGVVKDGEQVENVPELTEVVKRLKSYNIDKYIAKKSETRETQKTADDFDKKVQMSSLGKVINSNYSYYSSPLRRNYGISTKDSTNELVYTPILEKIQGKTKLEDFLVKGYSGDGDYTYEEVLQNIASAIDAHFFIVDTTVCFMSFNALLANSSRVQKAVMPAVDFWQLQDGSYELDINQYGYYNTVKVKYKNGTVTKCYDDLVRVYGEIAVTYNEPKLDYEAAMLKAQAYLSAHIRDFGMEIKATVLHSGKITPCNFIKLKNPLTMSEALFFIHGTSVQWSADNQTLICDLDLRFGPENPDGLEVPEAGTSYVQSADPERGSTASGNVSADVNRAAQEITNGCVTDDQKAFAIYDWVDRNVQYKLYTGSNYTSSQVLTGKLANCWDTAYLIYDLCTAVGVKCEVYNGTYHFLDRDWGHLWNRIYYKGKMVFADTGRSSRNKLGEHGAGRYIISQTCVAKNY